MTDNGVDVSVAGRNDQNNTNVSSGASGVGLNLRLRRVGKVLLVVGVLTGLVAGAVAWPRPSVLPDGTVLHEPLPSARQDTGGLQAGNSEEPVFVYDSDDEPPVPGAVRDDGTDDQDSVAAAPPSAAGSPPGDGESDGPPGDEPTGQGDPNNVSDDPAPPGGEVVYSAEGADESGTAPTTEDDRTDLDRKTEKEGMLRYHTVFDPAVIPFKRNHAKDQVVDDAGLVVGSPAAHPVVLAGTTTTVGRETFWASMLVELRPGVPVPIPSVSPESRILESSTTPAASGLTFLKDGADNFYVQADTAGRFRLQFLMDAPVHYFNRTLPVNVSLNESRKSFRGFFELPPVAVVARARSVWNKIGVSPQMSLAEVLPALVSWFRAFQPGDPPSDTGDVYVDIALGQIGICRHRSHGFVVTAQAMGIPARYVSNEAHVFVEVWIGGANPGWLRIDLGGGAEGLQVLGGENRVRHNPEGPDPFGGGFAGSGGPEQGQIAGADDVFGLPAMEPAREGNPVMHGVGPASGSSGTVPGSGGTLPTSGGQKGGLLPTFSEILRAEPSLFRGENTVVEGKLTGVDGAPIPDMPIQVRLVGLSAGTENWELGATRTTQNGEFQARVHIPGEIPVGRYQLLAESPGNGVYAPSITPR